jgi:hypothetical protein
MHFSQEEKQIFDISTFMVLGDGSSTLFWEDRWLDGRFLQDIAPDLLALIPRLPRKRRTVREALVELSWITDITGALSSLALWQYVQLWIQLRDVQLSAVDDGQPVLLQVLLQRPFRGIACLKLLEAKLKVVGGPQGEVLRLACLP